MSRPRRPAAPPLRTGEAARTPSFRERRASPLRELPPTAWHERRFLAAGNSYLRIYTLGECTVIVTREGGLYHLSISHRARLPAWDEIAEAWYRLVPGAEGRAGAMLLPPIHEYVNHDERCFQVCEIPAAMATE